MKFLQVDTAGDVRRWDTYIVAVPDDWDPDADDTALRLHDLIAQGKGQHQGTEYEGEHMPVPPYKFEITEVTEHPAAALTEE
ncbi:hypothetical protein [Nocardia terpenica]|uniref:Uncharacterized protein n=1 Tax=Nocardia terpenica TaxID=455432 RepID=A0A6G9ZE07_9NOCA|nr:hypothetical protein [Nocardia terpenica]QIS23684.1 hypothetical protein F6W96_40830 [Nocardia terpenica]